MQSNGNMDNVKEYLSSGCFDAEAKEFRKYSERKTGFSNWDEHTSLYPGLYVLGAITSLGKTSFCLQLADQLAAQGETVLYYSMEQTRLEMVSKSLSRYMRNTTGKEASSINIRRGFMDNGKRITDELNEPIAKYLEDVEDRIRIVECSFTVTLELIIAHIRDTIESTGKKPVVFIDYLQILKTERDLNDKQKIDYIVQTLKDTQKKYNLVFFVISSLNRQNYLAPVDFESFKESGGIEFTADVILGLQLQVLNDELFMKDSKNAEKRAKIIKAKSELPRKVELICLKNRYGISSYSIGFDYFPYCDLFLPEDGKISLKKPSPVVSSNGLENLDGFKQAPEYDDNIPF